MNSIALNVENEKRFSSRIEKFFSRYQIGSILKQCNAFKKQGVPVVQISAFVTDFIAALPKEFNGFLPLAA